MAIVIRDGVPLAPFTTLELGGPARHFVDAADEGAVVEALRWADGRKLPVALLGGGSNMVVSDAGFDGLVVRIATRGVRFETAGGDATVTAAAGEPWDALVAEAVGRGLGGLECLSGIPGLVGATPIQNVGAYGQEVAETIRAVRVLERGSWQTRALSPEECGFGYRDSDFKREPDPLRGPGRHLRAAPGRRARLALPGAGRAPGRRRRHGASHARRRARRRAGAAGRKVDAGDRGRSQPAQRRLLLHEPDRRGGARPRRWPRAPATTAAGCRAGRRATAGSSSPPAGSSSGPAIAKGLRRGPVGVSSAHALALVHHGGGTTAALIALAREIREAVRLAVRRHAGPGADFRRRRLEPRLRLSILGAAVGRRDVRAVFTLLHTWALDSGAWKDGAYSKYEPPFT